MCRTPARGRLQSWPTCDCDDGRLDMIRQGQAESSKPCSVIRVSECVEEKKPPEEEWLDSRICNEAGWCTAL
jgi:hypothetical protein